MINLEENEYQTRLKNFENITALIINPTLHSRPRFTDWYAHAKLNNIIWTYDILLLASKLWYSETIFWTDDGITSVSASICVLFMSRCVPFEVPGRPVVRAWWLIWILCGWICSLAFPKVTGTAEFIACPWTELPEIGPITWPNLLLSNAPFGLLSCCWDFNFLQFISELVLWTKCGIHHTF